VITTNLPGARSPEAGYQDRDQYGMDRLTEMAAWRLGPRSRPERGGTRRPCPALGRSQADRVGRALPAGGRNRRRCGARL